jgi:THH1/TOM1/TOM3 domain
MTPNDAVNYTIGAMDVILLLVASIQLIRFVRGSKRVMLSFTAKKLFHAVLVLMLLIRSMFFLMLPSINGSGALSKCPAWVLVCWNHWAEFLFIINYYILLVFWIDFYSHLRGQESRWLRRRRIFIVLSTTAVLLANVVLTLASAAVSYVYSSALRTQSVLTLVDASWALFGAALFLMMACGFLVYGVRLHNELKQHVALGIKLRHSGATPILLIGAICTLCFSARAAVNVYSASVSLDDVVDGNPSETKDFNLPWWVTDLFYSFTEVLPSALMIVLLGNLPQSQPVVRHRDFQVQQGAYHRY